MASGRVWRKSIVGAEEIGPASLLLAKDARGGGGRTYKMFLKCEDFAEYEKNLFRNRSLSHLYEVIPCGRTTPVWFFADHDCKGDAAGGMDERAFTEGVCRIYYEYFQIGREEVNRTMFVSSTCRPGKLSVHVKINVPTTLAETRARAACIASRCDPRLRPDLGVYASRFQQIRAAGSSKMENGVRKRPCFAIHPNYADHMVRINPACDAPRLLRAPPIRRPPSAPRQRDAAPAVRGEEIVRAALRSSDLPGHLGGAFDPDTCHIQDARARGEAAVSCYLDGSGRRGWTLVCPFAGRAHKTNRARLSVLSSGNGSGFIELACMSPGCRTLGSRMYPFGPV